MLFSKKSDLKKGDFVKAKEGVIHPELKIDISDWHGKLLEGRNNIFELELDAITLRGLSQETIDFYSSNDEVFYTVIAPIKDLELSTQRNSDIEVEQAQDELIAILEEKEEIEPHERLSDKWIRHFTRSDFYFELDQKYRDSANFILETFSDYIYRYEGLAPKQWDLNGVEAVCLEVLATKVTGEKELFEAYPIVLIHFFKFLEIRKYKKTESLQKLMLSISDEMLAISQDPRNWGMAKSFMMGAVNAGVDLENKEGLDSFLKKEQGDILSLIGDFEETAPRTLKYQQDFKNISRNDKVTVKYQDGKIVENVKFKKVQKDLNNGTCELMN